MAVMKKLIVVAIISITPILTASAASASAVAQDVQTESLRDGAYTAAGSVINEDVPAGAIGIGRARQINILGWVLRKRKGSKSADAAKNAGASE